MAEGLPYTIAVLCYLFDEQGQVLLLHRNKAPNRDMYSPIGGKLKRQTGESPADCALREIKEEADLQLTYSNLHLCGVVSETGFEQAGHWLMFLYEVKIPVKVKSRRIAEGYLEWHRLESVGELAIPKTDKQVIWPLFRRFRGRFFAVHIDCRADEFSWRLDEPPS